MNLFFNHNLQCSKCEKVFSPVYSSSQNLSTTGSRSAAAQSSAGRGEGEINKSINIDKSDGGSLPMTRGISSARQQQQLCVFCRLRDPSRKFSVDDYS